MNGYKVSFVARYRDVAIVVEKDGKVFQSFFRDTSDPEALRARLAAAGPARWLNVVEEIAKTRGGAS
jgi:hypothetical protein